MYGRHYDLKIDEVPPTGYEPIGTGTTETIITTDTRTTTTVATSLIGEQEDEATPLISQPRQTVDTVAQNLISYCSLVNNYLLLKHESQPKTLVCLNGIRVLSLWWVILGHTFIFAAYYSGKFLIIFINERESFFNY